MEFLTALAIGFLGSLHCIGMCGPIAVALPLPGSNTLSFIAGRLLYNIGRVIAYGILGSVFGLLGSRIVLFGFQQGLSIALGLLIIIYVVSPTKWKHKLSAAAPAQKIIIPLKSSIGKLFQRSSFSSLFIIGFLNGFLPCGFVYIGLAGAMAAGNAVSGMGVMVMFGIGTIPAMFAASVFGKFINLNIRRKLTKAFPALAILLALVFILRGLNLGIPYISPKFETKAKVQEINCCQ